MTKPPLGIIAGGGALPRLLAEACREEGRPYHIAGLAGFADAQLTTHPYTEVGLGAAGRLLKTFKEAGCTDIVMAGHVRRPDFSKLKLDMTGARLLPKILARAKKGDDGLLSSVVGLLEAEGFQVVGADDVLADLLVREGPLGTAGPKPEHWSDIRRGIDAVRAMGRLDIGQAAVICRELVLAVEAAEGTDQMLARCAGLPRDLRGTPEARAGVLVKMKKPGQERRADLPVIGLRTVEEAAAAGLAGIAVMAGGAMIIDRDGVRKAADRCGVFVYGFTEGEEMGRPAETISVP